MNPVVIRARAVADVILERERQIAEEGYSAAHDDRHDGGELARAGASYALSAVTKQLHSVPHDLLRATAAAWPFDAALKHKHEPRRMLVIAEAFLLAEIERLDRAQESGTSDQGSGGEP